MDKLNCWEAKDCGRIPGGEKVNDFGVCPAYTEEKFDTINDGKNGGRICWVVAGTFCGGKVQGVYASKLASCLACEFYKTVQSEEGKDWQGAKSALHL